MLLSVYPIHWAQGHGPGGGIFEMQWLLGALVLLLLWSYDVLTAITAVATMTLWSMNYPLLHLNRDVGNAGQWAVFVSWGVFVLGAFFLAFRPSVVSHWRQMKAAE
jgi:hypothetical protein